MSATMDAALLSSYFNTCPVLSAAGRTFPVEHKYLEDAYEVLQYRVDAEGPVAIRGGGVRRSVGLLKEVVSGGDQGIVRV